jgi:tetratricopeptide (TPR) repeat protein
MRGNFAFRLTSWGRFDEAIAMGREARKVHDYPRLRIILAEAHAEKARSLALQGKLSEAKTSLEAAEAETVDVGMVHIARGTLREKANDREGARKAYNRALELDPDLEEAKRALQRLGN